MRRIFMWVLLAVAVLALVFGTGARYHHYRNGSQPADMYVQPGDMYGHPADMYVQPGDMYGHPADMY